MSQLGVQKQNILDIKAARYITGALRDISAVELKKLRKKFEQNDMFFIELQELFQLVWRSAASVGDDNPLLKNKKKLYLAYTTNRHFYGSLNHDVMKKFIEGTEKNNECLIIGDTGRQIWSSKGQSRRKISFQSFNEDDPSEEEVDAILKTVEKYGHVYVFYPSFTSVFKQDVQMVDITFRPSSQTSTKDTFKDLPQYIFEPDLSQMIQFFNHQVRFTLFERLLLETQISRVAARLVKMDTADQNAQALIKTQNQELRRIRTSFSSRRMLETVVGFIQWHNRQTQIIGQ
jgi:ATP synthase F1 gamma subunit